MSKNDNTNLFGFFGKFDSSSSKKEKRRSKRGCRRFCRIEELESREMLDAGLMSALEDIFAQTAPSYVESETVMTEKGGKLETTSPNFAYAPGPTLIAVGGNDQADLNWTPFTDADIDLVAEPELTGYTVGGYHIQYSIDGENWTNVNVPLTSAGFDPAAPSLTLPLQEGIYTIQIRTIFSNPSGGGDERYSDWNTANDVVVTGSTNSFAIETPPNLTGAVNVSEIDGAIEFSFNAATVLGGIGEPAYVDIERYDIRYRETGSFLWVTETENTTVVYLGGTISVTINNLTPGTEYDIQVRALTDAYTGSVTTPFECSDWANTTLRSNNAAVVAPPETPTGLNVTEVTANSIALAWDATANADFYRLEYSLDGGTWIAVGGNIVQTMYTHTQIASNTTHFYRVSAFNVRGASDPSDVVEATTEFQLPEMPTGLNGIVNSANSVTLSWIASLYTDLYAVEYRIVGEPEYTLYDTPFTGTTANITVPAPNAQYEFRIRAENTSGESEWTEPIVLWLETENSPIRAPENITYVLGDGVLTLTWNGGTNVQYYVVRYRAVGDVEWTYPAGNYIDDTAEPADDFIPGSVTDVEGNVEITVIEDFAPPYAEYELQIYAVRTATVENPANPEEQSEPATLFAWVEPLPDETIPVPGYIELDWVDINGTMVNSLVWQDLNDGGDNAPNYVYNIQYKRADDDEWMIINDIQNIEFIPDAFYPPPFLEPGVMYDFQVRTVEVNGEGEPQAHSPWSATTSFPTPLPIPVNIQVIGRTATSMTLVWDEVFNAAGYEVQYRMLDGTDIGEWSQAIPADNTELTIQRLLDGMQYEFQVRAINDVSESYWSPSIAEYTMLFTPQINRDIPDSNTVTLVWDAINRATLYEVEYSVAGSGIWQAGGTSDTTSIRVVGLNEGTAYEFRVRALRFTANANLSNTESYWSGNYTASTVERLAIGSISSIILSRWTNQQDGSEYQFKLSSENDRKWITWVDGSMDRISIIFGLKSGTYDVRQIDVNGEVIRQATGVEVTSSPSTTHPKKPVVSVVKRGVDSPTSSTLTLVWKAPARSTYQTNARYLISCSTKNETKQWEVVKEITAVEGRYTFTDLDQNTSYRFAITAINAQGKQTTANGKKDVVATVNGKTAKYTAVKSLRSINKTGSEVTLGWQPSKAHLYLPEGTTTIYQISWMYGTEERYMFTASTTATITGLTPTTRYSFVVREVVVHELYGQDYYHGVDETITASMIDRSLDSKISVRTPKRIRI